jgi:putative transposase
MAAGQNSGSLCPYRPPKDNAGEKRHPARRWVVERTLVWLSKCRAILVRYEKKSCNDLCLWLSIQW